MLFTKVATMNEIKCPFCQQKLQEDVGYDGDYSCPNCRQPYFGSPELWQELIRTRKALDVAVDAIKNATEYLGNQEPLVDVMAMNLYTDLSKALEQITALEQKE
jgi:uncharacterized Zn finger protein (UPF0148 family)